MPVNPALSGGWIARHGLALHKALPQIRASGIFNPAGVGKPLRSLTPVSPGAIQI